jgi:hypothetical protein
MKNVFLKYKEYMMRIFKRPPEFRIPTEISREDWEKKYNMYGEVIFSKKEVEFFSRFSKGNKDHLVFMNHEKSSISLKLKSTEDYRIQRHSFNIGTTIIKLDDDWYLIHYYAKSESIDISRYYICDEWEEVIGYLVSNDYKL